MLASPSSQIRTASRNDGKDNLLFYNAKSERHGEIRSIGRDMYPRSARDVYLVADGNESQYYLDHGRQEEHVRAQFVVDEHQHFRTAQDQGYRCEDDVDDDPSICCKLGEYGNWEWGVIRLDLVLAWLTSTLCDANKHSCGHGIDGEKS